MNKTQKDMSSFDIGRRKLLVSSIAYTIVLIYIYQYAILVQNGGCSFRTGDWLINYEGGLVRRGLIGQLFFILSSLGINILWTAFTFQALIYLLIVYFLLKIFFAVPRNAYWLLILFSPTFILLFPLYDVWGGFRKEILLFLSYVLLLSGLTKTKILHKYIISSMVVFFIAAFSHEVTFFLSIFFVVTICCVFKEKNYEITYVKHYILFYLILAISSLIFSFVYKGDATVANNICGSLISAGLNKSICSGSIDALMHDARYGMANVASRLNDYYFYVQALSLSVFPLFLTNWWKKKALLVIFGFIAVVPLFVIAVDWGRWIHCYIVMLFMTLLFDSSRTRVSTPNVSLFVVIPYVSLWSVTCCCEAKLGSGIFLYAKKSFAYLFSVLSS